MKGFWSTLILVTLISNPVDPQTTMEKLQQNLGEVIDDALYAFNALDPIVLKKCTLLRDTVFLGVSVHGLRNIRRSQNITLTQADGSVTLKVYLKVEGLIFDFEFWLSSFRRVRSSCSVKLPPVTGFFVIKHAYTGVLQQFQIDELDRRKIDFECVKELPDDVTKKLRESLKLAMYAERIRIENSVAWYGKFAMNYIHMKKVMYRRFCKIGIPRYCDPGIDYEP